MPRTRRWLCPRTPAVRRGAGGHTLVEVLVAIALIVVIAAVVLTALWKVYQFVRAFTQGSFSSV